MPGRGRTGKAEDGQRAQMLVAEHRRQAAGQRRVDQHGVEIGGDLRHGDRMPPRRDAVVEIGQRLFVRERRDLGHDLRQQVERAIGAADETVEMLAIIDTVPLARILDQQAVRCG